MPDKDDNSYIQRQLLDVVQRVSSLEALQKAADESREELRESIKQLQASITVNNAHTAAIKEKITKWEGKFGGVLFVIGSIWAFVIGLPRAIVDWFKAMGGGPN